jgi:hypothetical protein
MAQNTDKATDFLKKIGSVDEVLAAAKKRTAHSKPVKFNTHIHLPPNFSAFDTVEHAVELAAEEGIRVLGAGNYYDFSVYREFAALTTARGIFPLFGTEIIALVDELKNSGIRINDPGNPGKFYICGKGISLFEAFSEKAAKLNSTIRKNDALRMKEMTAKMASVFSACGVDTGLDDDAVIDRVVARHNSSPEMVTLQERHLAQAFQEVFFEKVPVEQRTAKLAEVFGAEPKSDCSDAVAIQGEIRSNLMKAGKSCFVAETFVNLAQAKELITELGGIPCYPVLADGSKQMCEFETPLDEFITTLKANEFEMVEFIPERNSAPVLSEYAKALREAGFVVVAGTEHNQLDLTPLELRCAGGAAVPEDVNRIFWEGTCVLAGHSYLKANGREGFKEKAFDTTEDKIAYFRRTGEEVFGRFFN